jgi:hypothetical protein
VFIEIIQRLGCTKEVQRQQGGAADTAAGDATAARGSAGAHGAAALTDVIEVRPDGVMVEQAAGCGGFGKGNFSELFKR